MVDNLLLGGIVAERMAVTHATVATPPYYPCYRQSVVVSLPIICYNTWPVLLSSGHYDGVKEISEHSSGDKCKEYNNIYAFTVKCVDPICYYPTNAVVRVQWLLVRVNIIIISSWKLRVVCTHNKVTALVNQSTRGTNEFNYGLFCRERGSWDKYPLSILKAQLIAINYYTQRMDAPASGHRVCTALNPKLKVLIKFRWNC